MKPFPKSLRKIIPELASHETLRSDTVIGILVTLTKYEPTKKQKRKKPDL